MKFDFKNKFRNDNKNSESSEKINKEHEKIKEDNLKTEIISSILKGHVSGEEDKTVTFADLNAVDEELSPKSELKSQNIGKNLETKQDKLTAQVEVQQKTEIKSIKKISPESEKISILTRAIEASQEKMITPSVDINTGKISYPLLSQIEKDEDQLDFLEKLASPDFDILERRIYERLAVCPNHPESMSTSIRLICPRCSSMDISKLHLIEHKRCGYISENKNFEFSNDGQIIKCPSCKKPIRDPKREIAKPAMWYSCNECKEKFDDVSIRLHCRKFNHDFEISDAQSILIPSFSLKNLQETSNSSISPILKPLKNLLDTRGFSAEENYTVTGKSGNNYRINIYGEDEHKRTVFIYIKNPNAESDNSELNSKIIEVLDTEPTVTLLIGFPSISEKAKAIISNYNISLITEKDPDKILSSIKDILTQKIPNLES